ncbi:MAG: ATP-dependent exoDNAse (exonuclease V) beta subunit [Cellvibrionaceae bacterium]
MEIKLSLPPVDIMTIHKSKVLVFETVIIPGIDLSPTSDKKELMVYFQ